MATGRLRLHLLGAPRVEVDDPPAVVDLASQKGVALLGYLASRPDQTVARTRLIALLWEESDDQEGRNNLSTALSRLRRSLPGAPIVAVGDALVWRPASGAQTWTDAATFETLVRPGASMDQLDAAVALYRGSFLEGLDVRGCPNWDEWLDLERSAWQQRVLETLERAAEAHAAVGDWSGALAHSRRALALDPLQEHFHRLVMRLHVRAGDRAAALAHYRVATLTLANELGVEPDAETQRLYRAILSDVLPDDWPQPPTAAPVAATPRPTLERPPALAPAIHLVARQSEMVVLETAAEGAVAGRGRLVSIEGEGGIGKSRLVEELVWRLDGGPARDLWPRRPWTILIGACHESEQGLPYHPFVELLTGVVANSDWIAPIADVWLAEVARLVPDLLDQRPDLPTPTRLDPQQEQRRLFEGVSRLIAALPTPRLLIIEDIHWADDGSLRLLDYLARHDASGATLLMTTVRSEDASETLESVLLTLERERSLERVRLARLDVEATVRLLREVVHEDVRAFGHQLHAETEGNPLFAVETIRALLEAGHLHLGDVADLEQTALPGSVQAAIRARLARLDQNAHELARAVAVLGGAVDFDHARAVGGQDEDTALAALERLLRTQLLREVPGEPGEALYTFSHDKIRQVVYDDLSSARRRIQHRRALDVLAAPDARTPAERLAYHALRGQVWDQAARWCEVAGTAAVGVFAYASAASLYESALDSLGRLALTPERKLQTVLLRLRLAHVALYAAPNRLAEWLTPAEADARELGDPALIAHVQLAQAGALFIQGRLADALPLLEEIRPVADAGGDLQLKAQHAVVLGQVLALRGDYAQAVPTLQGAVRMLRQQPGIEVTVATEMLAATYAYMGEFETAFEILGVTHAQTESSQDQAALAASHGFLASTYQMQGDWQQARRFGELAIATARNAGNVVHEYVGLVFLGLPLAHLGDADAGAQTLRRAIDIATAAGTWVLQGRAHGWLAEVELERGDPETSLALAERGYELSAQHGYLFDAALCARARGKALLQLGRRDEAVAGLRDALGRFEAIGARPEQERTRQTLASHMDNQ